MTDDDLQCVAGVLLGAAKAGEPWAVHELLDRCIGKPTATLEVGPLDPAQALADMSEDDRRALIERAGLAHLLPPKPC